MGEYWYRLRGSIERYKASCVLSQCCRAPINAGGRLGVVFDCSGAVTASGVDRAEHRVTGLVGGTKLDDLIDKISCLLIVEKKRCLGGAFDRCEGLGALADCSLKSTEGRFELVSSTESKA